jgi:hypothetical protein
MDFFIILPIGKCFTSYLKLAQSLKPPSFHPYAIIFGQNAKIDKIGKKLHISKTSTAFSVQPKTAFGWSMTACLEPI